MAWALRVAYGFYLCSPACNLTAGSLEKHVTYPNLNMCFTRKIICFRTVDG